MEKLGFLLGDWDLHYHIPKSVLSEAKTGGGFGRFQRALEGKAVFFDYTSLIDGETGQAHGVFVKDEKTGIYRYWWFESSGAFMQASCQFSDDDTLNMNWHDSTLTQFFKRLGPDRVQLQMSLQNSDGGVDSVLEVLLTRKTGEFNSVSV